MTFRTQAGDFALVGTGRHIGVLAIEAVGTDRRADAAASTLDRNTNGCEVIQAT
ncbi:hypothetical protein IXO651_016230 [Xanthomonas oryzae pv. oryzae]|uniref:hypothetical protein n=1 Tax=Xanthomonas oryzae TaxID=347 RepID=UPI0021DA4B71|nr:hypothetical protein [Xanthomonas oryzae]UXW34094.1 hypothetical protein IXO651_016230 [Xanthomonas oryzae pv. oryzae]UXW41954.1 hypothetical protein IXO685_0019005 [Xanthomonas oryzae pv. oryzae]